MIVLAIDTSSAMGSTAIVRDGVPIQTATLTSLPGHSETLLYSVSRMLDAARISLSEIDLLAAGIGPGSFTGLRVGLAAMKGLNLSTGKPLLGVSSLLALAINGARYEARGARHEPETSDGTFTPAPRLMPHACLVCAAIDARRGDVFAAVYRLDHRTPDTAVATAGSRLAPRASCLVAEHMTRPEVLAAELERLEADVICVGDAFMSQLPPPASRLPPHAFCLVPPRPFMQVPDDEALHFPPASNVAAIAAERFSNGETDNAAALEPRYVRPVDFKPV